VYKYVISLILTCVIHMEKWSAIISAY
jgi:hypothetical protein